MKQMPLMEAVRQKIKAEGITIKQAAEVIGVHYSTLSKWISDKRQPKISCYPALRLFLTEGSMSEIAAAKRRREKLRQKQDDERLKALVDCWLEKADLPSEAFPQKQRHVKRTRPEHISEEQADVLCCIARYTLALEHAPWLDEIARDCRLDIDAVRRDVKALEKAGFVKSCSVHFAITSKGREVALQIETERIKTCAFT